MTEHRLLQQVIPECPECGAFMDSAAGPSGPPKNGDFALCAYCSHLSEYKAVPGGFVFVEPDMEIFTEEERQSILSAQAIIKNSNL